MIFGSIIISFRPLAQNDRLNVRKWAGNRISRKRMIPFYPPSWYCRKLKRRRCAISQPRVQPWGSMAKPENSRGDGCEQRIVQDRGNGCSLIVDSEIRWFVDSWIRKLVDLGIRMFCTRITNQPINQSQVPGRFFDSRPMISVIKLHSIRTTRSKWQDNVRKWAGNRISRKRMIPFYPPSWYCRKPKRRRCAISQPRVQPWVLEAKPIKFQRRWMESTDWCNLRDGLFFIRWLVD